MRTRILALLFIALCSCGYQTAGRANDPGLYECSNPHGGQVYRLHTEDPETLYFRGGGIALRFRDRLTGDLVELRRDSEYKCAKIES